METPRASLHVPFLVLSHPVRDWDSWRRVGKARVGRSRPASRAARSYEGARRTGSLGVQRRE